MMRSILAGALFAAGMAMLAVPAHAQDAAPVSSGELPRLSDLRLGDLPGNTGPARPIVQDPVRDPVDPDEDDDESTHDSLTNGTLTGLVVGGIIGALLALDCGHPECGMFIGMFAGLGAAVGVGVDAMFSNRTLAPVGNRARVRRAPFDRAAAVGFRKRW